MSLRALIVLVFGLVLTGCRDATSCDLCTSSVTVRGQISDAVGSPIENAVITLEPFSDTCGGLALPIVDSNGPKAVTSDDTGRFLALLRAPASPRPYCTRLTITPPTGRGQTMVIDRDVIFQADWPRMSTALVVVDVQLTR